VSPLPRLPIAGEELLARSDLTPLKGVVGDQLQQGRWEGSAHVSLPPAGSPAVWRMDTHARLLHDRQARPPLVLLDLLPPAAQLADRVRRQDVHLLLAQLRLAAADLVLELAALFQQAVEDLLLGHVGYLLALH